VPRVPSLGRLLPTEAVYLDFKKQTGPQAGFAIGSPQSPRLPHRQATK